MYTKESDFVTFVNGDGFEKPNKTTEPPRILMISRGGSEFCPKNV
jgi:hypothetical protein